MYISLTVHVPLVLVVNIEWMDGSKQPLDEYPSQRIFAPVLNKTTRNSSRGQELGSFHSLYSQSSKSDVPVAV